MSAPYIIPFNFQPINTVVGTTASYTVPAGKYARVVVNGSASTYEATIGVVPTNNPSSLGASAASDSFTEEIFLKEGDVLTTTTSIASVSVIGTAAIFVKAGGGVTTASVLINSVAIAVARAGGSICVSGSNSGVLTLLTLTGSASVGYIASEYNVIS